jgi:hypothetical protein
MTFLKAIYTMLVDDNYSIPNGLINCLYTYPKKLSININTFATYKTLKEG